MEGREEMANAGGILAEVYEAYFDVVYKFVYRRVRNEEVALDIVQDVFLAALDKSETFLKHPEQKKWLIVTAKNKLHELYRQMERIDPRSIEEISELEAEKSGYEEIEMEMTALAIIDKDEWELIKDYYLRGIKIRELAEKYGITENNMRVRLFRLRKKMKKRIKR